MTAKERTVKQEYRRNHSARKMARHLGWVSIGLGVAELLMPGPIARTLGIPAARGFIRLCGLREVVTGVGLLKSEQPKPWMTARVAGDALDLTRLSGAILVGNRPEHAMLATAAIAGVTSMDMACAKGLDEENHLVPVYDYSDRSGFPRKPEKMRGLAQESSSIRDTSTQVTGKEVGQRETR
jgi:hypothetical protein